jgi:hypothetical protein
VSAPMLLPEVAHVLCVSERQAQRIAHEHTLGVAEIYVNGVRRMRQRYDRDAVIAIAKARSSWLCPSCAARLVKQRGAKAVVS